VFHELLSNKALLCAMLSWCAAQVIKFFVYWAIEKKISWRRVWGSGGMPSSHTAFTVALSAAVGLTEGFGSAAFAVAFALMGVVIYDAMGVRYETGKQGKMINQINQILNELFVERKPLTDERLKELVGHSPIEVLGGVIVAGVVVTLYFI